MSPIRGALVQYCSQGGGRLTRSCSRLLAGSIWLLLEAKTKLETIESRVNNLEVFHNIFQW